MRELFKDYFLIHHKRSKHDIYLFRKQDLAKSQNLADDLIEICQNIQDQIWNKKFDTKHNTIDNDFLYLAVNSTTNTVSGFFSTSFKYYININSVLLYHSDAMILPDARNKGLLKFFFYTTNLLAAKEFTNIRILNIVATGYIHLFKHFELNTSFNKFDWQNDSEISEVVNQILKKDFDGIEIEQSGKITGGWQKQNNNLNDVWPEQIAKQFNFPLNVNYFNGDVLVRTYEFNTNFKLATE